MGLINTGHGSVWQEGEERRNMTRRQVLTILIIIIYKAQIHATFGKTAKLLL